MEDSASAESHNSPVAILKMEFMHSAPSAIKASTGTIPTIAADAYSSFSTAIHSSGLRLEIESPEVPQAPEPDSAHPFFIRFPTLRSPPARSSQNVLICLSKNCNPAYAGGSQRSNSEASCAFPNRKIRPTEHLFWRFP